MKILFYKAKYGNYTDRVISLWTKGPYSHTELQFSDGICFSSSLWDGGTRFKNINIKPERWDSIELDIKNEYKIRSFCESQVKLPYDLRGIFGLAIKVKLAEKKKWFCSEICCYALNLAGILVGVDPNISPNLLYKTIKTEKWNIAG